MHIYNELVVCLRSTTKKTGRVQALHINSLPHFPACSDAPIKSCIWYGCGIMMLNSCMMLNSFYLMCTEYVCFRWQFPVYTAGVAAILVQFPIDHFRSIGWYNVILGVLYIFLLFTMFHGESNCHCENICRKCGCTLPKKSNWKKTMVVGNVVVILVSLTWCLEVDSAWSTLYSCMFFVGQSLREVGGCCPQGVNTLLHVSALNDALATRSSSN